MRFIEVTGDLFSADPAYTLAHCVSADCAMSAGIASQFRKRYPQMPAYCLALKPAVGAAVLYRGERIVINLVTKNRYFHKPTYDTLEASLRSMRDVILGERIAKIAIPLIGCGLDRLEWHAVRKLIDKIFSGLDIEIVVYCL